MALVAIFVGRQGIEPWTGTYHGKTVGPALRQPLIPAELACRLTAVAVGASHLAFRDFIHHHAQAVPFVYKALYGIALLSAHVIKLQDYRIRFTAINAGMCGKVIPYGLSILSLNSRLTFSDLWDDRSPVSLEVGGSACFATWLQAVFRPSLFAERGERFPLSTRHAMLGTGILHVSHRPNRVAVAAA
jgi:hypothetical protein